MPSETLEAICDKFESDWQAGRAPRIESLLSAVGTGDRPALLRELIQIELRCRRDEFPPPRESEFRSRFPSDLAIVVDAFAQFSQRQLSEETMAAPGQMTMAEHPDDFRTVVEDGSERDRVRLSPDAPQRQFGRYLVKRELGRGGMGAVYLAHDEKLNRKVALKIPTFHENVRKEMISRFLREARTAGALRGAGICPIFDVGEIDGQFFIAMAYIEGRPLRDDTRQGKPHDVENTVRLIREIASAMSEAHEAGIIHRDLKPANIMMKQDRQPVIMDFGLARSTSEVESHLTGTGTILGTPTYMSPEQAMGDTTRIGPATDIYSLGIIFYEMLAGRAPFKGNVTAVLTQIATTEPKPLNEYGLGIAPAIVAIVSRMIAKQVEERFASMAEVVSELTAYLTGGAGRSQTGDAATASVSQSLQPLSGAVVPSRPSDTSLDHFLHLRDESTTSPLDSPEGRRPASSQSDRSRSKLRFSRTSRRIRAADLATVGAGIATVMMLLGGLYFSLGDRETSDSDTTQTSDNSDTGRSRTDVSTARARNSIGMRFVPIRPGTFTMGEGDTAHQVTLTRPFELGQYEVTQEQYERVTGNNPSGFPGPVNPVNTVSWKDAVEFCRKLSELPEEQASGFVYRLPTEAEWEYACRAGTTTTFSFGDDEILLDDYAWHAGSEGETRLYPVGQKKPNPWGLYDMLGNTWEWCQDRYGSYPSGSVTDPAGPESGSNRVYRGASVGSRVDAYRSAYRDKIGPDHRSEGLGFRVVRAPAAPAENSIGMRFVPIAPGTFTMGQGGTAHQVTLTQRFELGQYEVTLEQYEQVMGNHLRSPAGSSNPVNNVSWRDAVEFCRKLSELSEEQAAGFAYRLPTEAEWEYACRAGTTTTFSFGDDDTELWRYAWYKSNSDGKLHPIGQKNPNPWGLYDMHGNVFEWCQDWYDAFPSGSVTDPGGPSAGSGRVLRSGGMDYHAVHCSSATRFRGTPGLGYLHTGFRIVRFPATALKNSIGMHFVPIKPGTFTMGEGETAHQVTLTQRFELGQYEVTQEQYERVMGNNFSSQGGGLSYPVNNVIWNDAVEFCRRLSDLPDERAAGFAYRLPTEAEWEYACRAGTGSTYSFGDNPADLRVYAWYEDNSDGKAHPVGQKKPNLWGLYDMHGNVWEWCQDWYGSYPGGPVTDPGGAQSGSIRVNRGGSWRYNSEGCRSACRDVYSPAARVNSIGFRVARVPVVPVENSIGMRFVPIKPGTFTMGEGETAHQVTLTQPFELGQYEVTQEQYEQVIGSNPSQEGGLSHPVSFVRWHEAVEFCRLLSGLPDERAAGFAYRLPTEAEWEYACRAGTTTMYSSGGDDARLGRYAWYKSNSDGKPHPVGQKNPNPWGLYDMHGNVWEWCQDWHDAFPSGSVTDPGGPSSGSERIDRGGSWADDSRYCRSTERGKIAADARSVNLGFRVVRVPAASVENSIGMRFVPIKPGTFTMGEGETAHQVTLTQPFELGQYEVTQEQNEQVMGNNPSHSAGPAKPVTMVSWEDAGEFFRKLSALPEAQASGFVYRLPTEAEWEYTCRAGTKTAYSFGDDEAQLGGYAWYRTNSGGDAHPVGGKQPNPWDLYDMHGNVWEWCQDRYGIYPSGSVTDPTGPSSGKGRRYRGGSWNGLSEFSRAARRGWSMPDVRSSALGFRVLRSSVR